MNSRTMDWRTRSATVVAVVLTVLYLATVALDIYMGTFIKAPFLAACAAVCLAIVWVCVTFMRKLRKAMIVLDWAKTERYSGAANTAFAKAMRNSDGTARKHCDWWALARFYNQHPDYDPEMEKEDA